MQARMVSTAAPIRHKVAVVLSGCGVYDGSEVHETAAILAHLTRNGAEPKMYAPDIDQMHVINYTKGEPMGDTSRNVLLESARIARGNIENLNNLKQADHDALVFPGGFGVAKNLSTFAVDGPNLKVNEEVERVLKEFHASKKPIALCCIAPILAAKVFGSVQLTLGQDKDDESGSWPYAGAAEAAKSLGVQHHNCNVNEIFVDEKNLIVTTPAFMNNNAKFHEISDGIGNMIKSLIGLMSK